MYVTFTFDVAGVNVFWKCCGLNRHYFVFGDMPTSDQDNLVNVEVQMLANRKLLTDIDKCTQCSDGVRELCQSSNVS